MKKHLKKTQICDIIWNHVMMKSANLQQGISESVGTAETDAYPTEDAFPFGAYRMNRLVVWYGKAPLSACKVLALYAEKQVVPRVHCFSS